MVKWNKGCCRSLSRAWDIDELRRLKFCFDDWKYSAATSFSRIFDNIGSRDIGLYWLIILGFKHLRIKERLAILKQDVTTPIPTQIKNACTGTSVRVTTGAITSKVPKDPMRYTVRTRALPLCLPHETFYISDLEREMDVRQNLRCNKERCGLRRRVTRIEKVAKLINREFVNTFIWFLALTNSSNARSLFCCFLSGGRVPNE